MDLNFEQIARTTEKLRGSLQSLVKNKGEIVTREIIEKGRELDGLLNDFINMLKNK